jgi:hypothetical protein
MMSLRITPGTRPFHHALSVWIPSVGEAPKHSKPGLRRLRSLCLALAPRGGWPCALSGSAVNDPRDPRDHQMGSSMLRPRSMHGMSPLGKGGGGLCQGTASLPTWRSRRHEQALRSSPRLIRMLPSILTREPTASLPKGASISGMAQSPSQWRQRWETVWSPRKGQSMGASFCGESMCLRGSMIDLKLPPRALLDRSVPSQTAWDGGSLGEARADGRDFHG